MERAASFSFSLNIIVMKVIGFYPLDSHQNLYKAYSVTIYILTMIPLAVLGTLHFVFSEDSTNFDYNDFAVVGMIFYSFKFLPLVINNKKVKTCIHYLDDLYYSFLEDEYKKIIIEECVGVCRRNSKVFLVGCIASFISVIGQVIIKEDSTQLPLNVWLSMFVINNPLFYYNMYFVILLGFAYAVLACATVDPLIGGLAYHATAQLQILKESLRDLDLHIKEEFSPVKNRKINLGIKNCVLHYQAIIIFVHKYEDCVSPVVFSQFIESGFTIGLLLFQMSKGLALDINSLIMINYLVLLFFQIFFYCYYGQLLIEENKNLTTSVYMSRWYEYSIESKRALSILMERSKRSIVVTAGKLFDLSLDTFTTTLKRAYSLLAVLRNY